MYRSSSSMPLAVFAWLFVLCNTSWGQFLVGNGTEGPQIEAPDGLSSACSATFNQTVSCSSALYYASMGLLTLSATDLDSLCTDGCLGSLESLRAMQQASCSESDAVPLGGLIYPATFETDELMLTFNISCLRDTKTNDYCFPTFDQINNESSASSADQCSDCNLRTFQTQLDSPLGWDDDLADSYSSLTASCGVTAYQITSPAPYILTGNATATATETVSSTAPSATCQSTYTVKDGDDCHTVSESQHVSTADLMFSNKLAGYCSNFPGPGTSLCIPYTCDIYTVVSNDTCYGIAAAYDGSFTPTQLMSWNANINRDCTNLAQMVGYQICVSFPGDPQVVSLPTGTSTITATAVVAPTNVPDGTNRDCAKYYQIGDKDTCASVSVANSISLTDFYFLNPEINNPNCTNLLLGLSYCVQAVGDISSYSGYNTATGNPCASLGAPSSCFVTTYPTDTFWDWPTATSNGTATVTNTASYPNVTVTGDLPLASGSWANCSDYDQYFPITSNKTTINPNTCDYIAFYHEIDVQSLLSWNPSLVYNESNPVACQLAPGYRYCVDTSGDALPTTTTATSSSSASSGSTVPSPTQSGLISTCNKFYDVQANDGCYDIAAANGISLDSFYTWNPAVGTDCSALYPDYYVCVGISVSSTATPTITSGTTSTSASGGAVTPTPTQSGMATGCTEFYDVVANDGCYDIAAKYGISLDDFYAWNPAVKTDCSGLYPGYYVCVSRT